MKKQFDRQSFLGEHSQTTFQNCRVGIIGLGGGGSHVVQQLAHAGFGDFILYDPDIVEDSNLNRMVGATLKDAKRGNSKIAVAKRTIKGLNAKPAIKAIQDRWQNNPEPLKRSDLIFGCVDTFAQRRELEILARRHLIPYIDIGMDVHPSESGPPGMAGQVILSLPGGPCMSCIGFLTGENLAKEAAHYGAAGGRPQVIWANGVLASTAVGVAIDMLTNWSQKPPVNVIYMSYNGNEGTLQPHVRLKYLPEAPCPHFPPDQVGNAIFRPL